MDHPPRPDRGCHTAPRSAGDSFYALDRSGGGEPVILTFSGDTYLGSDFSDPTQRDDYRSG